MTVKELIEKLAEYPAGAEVVYQCYSDYCRLDADEIRLIRAEDEEVARWDGRPIHARGQWYGPTQVPEWLTVVAFPGN